MKLKGSRNRGSHPLRAATRESGLYLSCAYPVVPSACAGALSRRHSRDATELADSMSKKDIEIYPVFDIVVRKTHANFHSIQPLHQTLRATYTEPEAAATPRT